MRTITLRVADEQRPALTAALAEKDVDFVVTQGAGRMADSSVVELAVPTDGVGDVLSTIEESGVDEEGYTVISPVEAAMTPNAELLLDRYASDFDPLSTPELRSKARDLSRDARSFGAMIFLSAVIATAGLLTGSAAVIVGSMVIAPIVGPVLTAGVGTVTADREMVGDSVVLQVGGLVVAVVGATLTGVVFRSVFLVPTSLDLVWLEAIGTRIAPNFLSVLVGLAAGGAAAFGLSTKGPTSIIGVMIAAALIPTAAAIGIALVWGYPMLALGTLVLLASTILAINAGVVAVLWSLGYRRVEVRPSSVGPSTRSIAAVVLAAAVVVGAAATLVGTYQHVTFEKTVTEEVERTLDDPAYTEVGLVQIRPQYGGVNPFQSPTSVTVVVSRPTGESHPDLAATLGARISASTDRDVGVRVRFVEYQHAPTGRSDAVLGPPTASGPASNRPGVQRCSATCR